MNTYTVVIVDNTIGSRTYRVQQNDAQDSIKDAFYQALGSGLKSDYNVNSVTLTKLNVVS